MYSSSELTGPRVQIINPNPPESLHNTACNQEPLSLFKKDLTLYILHKNCLYYICMFKPSIAENARVQEQTLIFLSIYILQLVIRWRPRINQTSLWMSLFSRIMRNVLGKTCLRLFLPRWAKTFITRTVSFVKRPHLCSFIIATVLTHYFMVRNIKTYKMSNAYDQNLYSWLW